MIGDKKMNWYVAHTRVNQELFIKKKLDELGIENFLPCAGNSAWPEDDSCAFDSRDDFYPHG